MARKTAISVPSSSGSRVQRNRLIQPRLARGNISVPSSSGSRVQPNHGHGGQQRSGNFSPLFIGESRSTSQRCAGTASTERISVPSSSGSRVQLKLEVAAIIRLSPFQSPLHRGVAFNIRLRRLRVIPTTHFSPLFIGESRSTAYCGCQARSATTISVPSSSGSRVQRSQRPW